jgi:hypothetical protein
LSAGAVWQGQQHAFLLATLFFAASFLDNRWLRYFFYYACASSGFFMFRAAFGMTNIAHGSNALMHSIYLMVAVIAYIAVVKSRVKTADIYNVICISAMLQAVIAFFQYFGLSLFNLVSAITGPTNYILPQDIMVGTLGNSNFMAAYIGISLPFFFRKKWIFLAPVLAVVIFMSGTTSTVIAVCAGLMIYFRKLKYLPLFLTVAVLYAIFFDPDVFGTNERYEFWGVAITKIFKSPLNVAFGLGPGTNWGRPFPLHNEWLSLFFSYGLIGFYLIVCYFMELKTENKILIAALLIAAVNALGNYPMHIAPTAFLVIVILALIEKEGAKTRCRGQNNFLLAH